ncbi:MAG: AAA family ATPase [Alphaproteobacteria bacterium]
MKIKPLPYSKAGIPQFVKGKSFKPLNPGTAITLFDLSSHRRARDAMDFGLKMRHLKFHIFVVGEDRSGRMTATMSFLSQHIKSLPPPPDWVYLNNFVNSHAPLPFQLPPGKGVFLREHLNDLIESIRILLNKTFSHPDFLAQIDAMSTNLEEQIQEEINKLRKDALSKGLEIEQSTQGFLIHPQAGKQPTETQTHDLSDIRDRLSRITSSAHMAGRHLTQDIGKVKAAIMDHAIAPLLERFAQTYQKHLGSWIKELKQDLILHIEDFLSDDIENDGKLKPSLAERYAVNVLVDNSSLKHPHVVLEPNPTYENIFGSIKYRTLAGGGLETNLTMIRPGALHRANGGILVLRAEGLAKDFLLWDMLKAALRDQHIRIEEVQREHSMPLVDAPAPDPIPLDLQIFIVGAPVSYYSFFYMDPDFKSYFKIKADIDPDMEASAENLAHLSLLIQEAAQTVTQMQISDRAVSYLIGYSTRWVGNRTKVNARFELIVDVIGEASIHAQLRNSKTISSRDIREALIVRRERNARIEDRTHEYIVQGQVHIQTEGTVVGQVNGMAIHGSLDHSYGIPSRISARTYMGESGVINIERLIDMSGPIQQKGAFITDGLLNGMFSQDFPVSFNCSLTFEQNYSDVEGDSASMAEVLVILSSLSDIALRQDLAVTGSVDQFGFSQAVGGVAHKIEGFYRVCKNQGFTGTQGVIIPWANVEHVIVRDEIVEDMKRKNFFIWPVKTVFEALELMTGQPAGTKRLKDGFTKGSVCDAIYQRLKIYHSLLETHRR